MRQAHELAKSAEGRTTPDPMVGAVLVKKGMVLATGFHSEVATPHAEAWAIQKAGEAARGATLYVNLEPCGHYGNNPPCTDAIINAEIRRVVISMKDPNPLVNGQGLAKLKRYGIRVEVGLLEEEAQKLNEVFVKYITTGRPFVVMKTAMTIDGKIATRTGKSRWVAGPASLRFAHHLRNVYDSILVGINNVLVDNPKLNVRRVKRIKNPIRIVLDSFARLPLEADLLKTRGGKLVLAVGPKAPRRRVEALLKRGAEVIRLPAPKGRIDIKALLKDLGERKITSLLVEGGGEVNASFLKAQAVDKAHFIIAPKIFGGRDAKTAVEGDGVALPSQAKHLRQVHVDRLGPDILVSGYFLRKT